MGTITPAHSRKQGEVTCWLLDTRELWPGDNILDADGAADALAMLSVKEQNAVRAKMFVQDARMSLGSALLKRLYISKTLGIDWESVRVARKGNEKHGKPCAVDIAGLPIPGIDFNVSHQGGLVAFIGYRSFTTSDTTEGSVDEVKCGVDLVCVNERNDYRTIDEEGFDGWIDVYEYVFSNEERWSMKYDVDYITLKDGSILNSQEIGRHDRCISRDQKITLITAGGKEASFSSELIVESKLRRFYAYFCYKEAYIKMTGEALLAPWLKQLEFFNVRSPKSVVKPGYSMHGIWGEEVDDVEVCLHGQPVSGVRMRSQAFEENFMISTAIQGEIEGLHMPGFQMLDLQIDVLAFASSVRELQTKESMVVQTRDLRSHGL